MNLLSIFATRIRSHYASLLVRTLTCAAMCFALSQSCRADFQLFISSPDPAGPRTSGDILTFEVLLSTTDPFIPLSTVVTGVEFDAALLGVPISATLGSIVPTPDNGALDFTTGPGSISFIFDPIFASPLPPLFTSTGLLFSFQVQVQPGAEGVAVVNFSSDPAATLLLDNLDQAVTVNFSASNNIFTVSAVPEPSTLAILALAGSGCLRLSTRSFRLIKKSTGRSGRKNRMGR